MTKEPEDKQEDAEDDESPEEKKAPSSDDSPDAADDDELDDDESDDDESDDDEPDEDEEEEEEPKRPAAARGKAKAAHKPGAKKFGSKPGLAARGRRRKKAETKGTSTRNIILYVVVIGGIALAFAYLGQQDGGGAAPTPAPKWKTGDNVDVSITLVTTDVKDLACASEKEVGGLHCAFADKRKAHPKGGDARNDANILQPYTTTDRLQFLAAGMWAEPEIKAKLDKENWDNPSPRFTVNCKYQVAGKMDEAHVRWKPEHGWLADAASEWYAGKLSDCKIRKSGRAVRRPRKGAERKTPEKADKPAAPDQPADKKE